MERRTLIKAAAMAAAAAGAGSAGSEQPASTRSTGSRQRRHPATFIETDDGTRLFCRDWGDGAPVVFCHPWGLNSDIWEYQAIELSDQGLRCITYDRRGHGRSDDPGKGYDYDTLAGDLAALLEQRDLRNVTLVGYSMGSGEVIRYVSRYGAQRVARAVFVSPVAPVPGSRAMSDTFIANLKKDRPAFMTAALPMFTGRDSAVSPPMAQWVLNQFLRSSPKAIIECQRQIAAGDHRAHLRAMTMPVLIVQGDKDEVSPLELTGRKLAEAISGSQLKIYEGAPHGIVLTHRDRFTQDLLSYIHR